MDGQLRFADPAMESLGDQTPLSPTSYSSGLLAPCGTRMLTSHDLAQVLADEGEGGAVLEPKMHGVIDQVDSKLVTELQKKLSEEAAHGMQMTPEFRAVLEKKMRSQQGQTSAEFEASLQEALNRQVAEQMFASQAVGSPTSAYASEEVETSYESGLRAPQPTVKLSPESLTGLDDEELHGLSESHGPIDQINDKLVQEVHRKFRSQESEASILGSDTPGLVAPQNTTRLNPDMMAMLNEEDDLTAESIDLNLVTELQRRLDGDQDDGSMPLSGRIAPQTTMKLEPGMLQALDD